MVLCLKSSKTLERILLYSSAPLRKGLADLRERIAHRLDAATSEDKAWVLQILGVKAMDKDDDLKVSVSVRGFVPW